MNDNLKEDLEARPTLSFPPPRPISFICQCGCRIHVSEGEVCFKYKGILFAMGDCIAKYIGAEVIYAPKKER